MFTFYITSERNCGYAIIYRRPPAGCFIGWLFPLFVN